MKICPIYDNKAHWIFEADIMPEFASNIIIKDITNLVIQPEEGWDYNEATDTFSEPMPIPPQSYQPTNEEVAQMISDLQADLVILGVI